jgi:TadE-like protein
MRSRSCLPGRLSDASGQSLIEFAVILPFVLILVLGVIEVAYALQDQHLITKLTREGSNLISRDTSLEDAATSMKSMGSLPVNFADGSSKIIFSVIKRGATTGSPNYDKMLLYQRYAYGTYSGTSALKTRGSGSFGGAPDFQAVDSDSNTSLQITNLPTDLVSVKGAMIYVTEIFTRHALITPVNGFGLAVPQTLYSIAYF